MRKRKLLITVWITLAVTVCCCGCNSRAEKKQAMIEKWGQNTAKSNVRAAQGLLENGEIAQAVQILEECISDSPDLVNAHLLMGKANFMQNRFKKAKKSFGRVLKLDDQQTEAWYWLGETQSRLGEHDQALKSYKEAMEIDSTISDYVIASACVHASMDEYDKAVDLLREKEKGFAGDTSFVIAHADMLMRSGRKEEAIKVYQSGLLFNSKSPELLEALGYCYMLDKQWEDAAEMFEKLLADAKDSQKQAYLDILSTCNMNIGEYARALGYLDRIKSDSGDDAQHWNRTGQASLGAGQYKRAIACAQRALFLRSGWSDAKLLLGCAQYMNKDYNTAIRIFSEMLHNKKAGNFAWMMTGKCYQQLGEKVKAAKAFDNVEFADASQRMTRLLKKVVDR